MVEKLAATFEVPLEYVRWGFYGTRTYYYFARNTRGQKHYEDDVPAESPIRPRLMQILSG